jgi:hypothetical protein
MATPSQFAANARNAKKPTGPKTPEGKAKSSKNALKHGLRSEEIVLRSLEFDEDWQAHLQSYIEDAQPVGDIEFKLAETAAMCLWKKSRAAMMLSLAQDTQIENKAADLIHDRAKEPVPIDNRGIVAQQIKGMNVRTLAGSGDSSERIREAWQRIDLTDSQIESYFRYYNSFERGFYRAYRELEKRRIERKKDAQRAEKLELYRLNLSMKAPSKPTFAMLLSQFEVEYDEGDLEFLLAEGWFNEEERCAARRILNHRLRAKDLEVNRAKRRAEVDRLAQEQAANQPEEEFDNDSAPPWARMPNLYKYPTDNAEMTSHAVVEKIGPIAEVAEIAVPVCSPLPPNSQLLTPGRSDAPSELASNGQGAENGVPDCSSLPPNSQLLTPGHSDASEELGSNVQGTQVSCESMTCIEQIGSVSGSASDGMGDAPVAPSAPILPMASAPECSQGQSA